MPLNWELESIRHVEISWSSHIVARAVVSLEIRGLRHRRSPNHSNINVLFFLAVVLTPHQDIFPRLNLGRRCLHHSKDTVFHEVLRYYPCFWWY